MCTYIGHASRRLDPDYGKGVRKVNHYSIDEKEEESSVRWIQAALPPRNTSSKPKNKDILQLLNESGIQYHYQSDSQGSKDNTNDVKNPFTNLWGVY